MAAYSMMTARSTHEKLRTSHKPSCVENVTITQEMGCTVHQTILCMISVQAQKIVKQKGASDGTDTD